MRGSDHADTAPQPNAACSSCGEIFRSQTVRDVAEMIAKFRTPPGCSWIDLANDIETFVNIKVEEARDEEYDARREW